MEGWTADVLVMVAGALLSFLAYVIPPFRRWQESLGEWTPAFMLLVLLGISIVKLLWFCQLVLACIQVNWLQTLMVLIAAFGANQGFYLAKVKPSKKAEAIAKYEAARLASLTSADDKIKEMLRREADL